MFAKGVFDGDTAGVALMVVALLVALATVLVDWRPGDGRRRRDRQMAAARAQHPAAVGSRSTRISVTPPPLSRMSPVVVRTGRHCGQVRQWPEAGA